MTKNILVFSLGCVALACGPDSTFLLGASAQGTAQSELAEERPFPLPLRYQPEADELAYVHEVIAKQFPGANATVSNARGTPAFIYNFTVPLNCEADGQVGEAVLEALAAYPDVFRLNTEEWAGDGNLTCGQVSASVYVPLARQKAGANVAGDQTITVRVSKLTRTLVVVDFFVGYYLPAGLLVEAGMSAAQLVGEKQLVKAVWKTDLPYSTFNYCVPTGGDVWNVAGGDDITINEARWMRDEDATGTTMWPQRTAEVRIAPGNVKPVLLQSNAYCPPTVGWSLSLDALKGEVRDVSAGLGCIVCFAP